MDQILALSDTVQRNNEYKLEALQSDNSTDNDPNDPNNQCMIISLM